MQESGRIAGSKPAFSMSPEMKLGIPTLRVREPGELLPFYEDGLGLKLTASGKDETDGLQFFRLAPPNSTEPLLTLKEDKDARMPSHDSAGLYHYAVLVPSRRSLASTYLGLGMAGVSYEGFADHYVSEALYLHDVERNGIEIYADRPRETWSSFKVPASEDGSAAARRFKSLNKPLDFGSLLRELDRQERSSPVRFAEGARIGHMHLRVTDLARSVEFYHEVMGLDIMVDSPEIGAAFLSVGGYHHHLGLNVWHSRGGTPRRGGEAGLDKFEMVVPEKRDLDELQTSLKERRATFVRDSKSIIVSDPDGIRIEILAQR